MKLSIFAVAMGISTAAATMCWGQDIRDTTTAQSPLVADCQALADEHNTLPEIWLPTEENNNSFDIFHGSCGIRGVFSTPSDLPADQMTITASLVSNMLRNVMTTKAVDGRASATGSVACMIPGMNVKMGWLKWEIYKVTSCQSRAAARRAVE